MSIKDKWFYERYLPETTTYESDEEVSIYHGKIVDDLGNGFYEVQSFPPNGPSVVRVFNVSDMSDWMFWSSYDELQVAMAGWSEIIRQKRDLDRQMASLEAALDDSGSDNY